MERPKPGPNDSSSDDLEAARLASRRLKGAKGALPAAAPGYVSFAPRAMQVPPPVRPSVPLMPRRQLLRAPSTGFGSEAWNTLLDAALATVKGESAMLMNPNGLIIASRGPRSGDELEAVGARLMVAFEQADRIDGEQATLCMSVEMARGTLHGLRLQQPEGGCLTLGLLIPSGLTAERQTRLLTLLTSFESRTI